MTKTPSSAHGMRGARIAARTGGWVILGGLLAALLHPLWGPVSAQFLLARPCPSDAGCHQTWTLPARLGQVLEFYEARLGPRDDAYRVLGVEFTAGRRPGIRFPNFGNGQRTVIVQLTKGSAEDREFALFQLAHEVFHIIEPVKPGAAVSVFEEGLASYFAVEFLKQQGMTAVMAWLSEPAYVESYKRVLALTKVTPEFDARLKRLRAQAGSFSGITAAQLIGVFPQLTKGEARRLAAPFN